jgi:hypothetical protein
VNDVLNDAVGELSAHDADGLSKRDGMTGSIQ